MLLAVTIDKLFIKGMGSHSPQDGEGKEESRFKISEGFAEGIRGFGCSPGVIGSHGRNPGQDRSTVRFVVYEDQPKVKTTRKTGAMNWSSRE